MTDLEMTRLCAEAMGLEPIAINGGEVVIGITPDRYVYHPLHDDAQAMDLVKRFHLDCGWFSEGKKWWANDLGNPCGIAIYATNLNRAIVECVAKMQAAKNA